MLFHLHDQVRFLTPHGDVSKGSTGRVVGRFGRPSEPSYFVLIDGQPAAVHVAATALKRARAS
jgi:hypothetical protein